MPLKASLDVALVAFVEAKLVVPLALRLGYALGLESRFGFRYQEGVSAAPYFAMSAVRGTPSFSADIEPLLKKADASTQEAARSQFWFRDSGEQKAKSMLYFTPSALELTLSWSPNLGPLVGKRSATPQLPSKVQLQSKQTKSSAFSNQTTTPINHNCN